MKETQSTITEWSKSTFGQITVSSLLARLQCEVAELLEALMEKERVSGTELEYKWVLRSRDELTDVCIMALQVAERFEVDSLSIEGVGLFSPAYSTALSIVINKRFAQMLAGTFGEPDFPSPAWKTWYSAQRKLLKEAFQAIWSLGLTLNIPPLLNLVDLKMGVNRKRKWTKGIDGVWQHEEESK